MYYKGWQSGLFVKIVWLIEWIELTKLIELD